MAGSGALTGSPKQAVQIKSLVIVLIFKEISSLNGEMREC